MILRIGPIDILCFRIASKLSKGATKTSLNSSETISLFLTSPKSSELNSFLPKGGRASSVSYISIELCRNLYS